MVTRVAEPEMGIHVLDVWSAVGTEPRPAFGYIVTVPIDLALDLGARIGCRCARLRGRDGFGRWLELLQFLGDFQVIET